jgi:outer membrane protein
LQIVQAEENLKVANEQHKLTESQLERALLLEKSGATNQSNTLLLKAQAASDQVAIINAENAIQIAYNTLINLMQLPLDQSIEIALMDISTLPEAPAENVAEIYELALSNLPEVQQAKLQILQSQLGEKIAGAGLQPTLSAYGNINTVYSQSGKDVNVTGDFTDVPIGYTQNSLEPVLQPQPVTIIRDKAFGNQLTDNLGQQVGVSLSVPIFNGYRNRTALENAKVNTQISELSLENTKNQLRNDITTAYTNLKAAKSRYEAAVLNVQAQQLSYNFSQKRFDAGVMNSVDLLSAKNLWNQAQIQALNAKYEYVFRTLIIDFYKGNQLKL